MTREATQGQKATGKTPSPCNMTVRRASDLFYVPGSPGIHPRTVRTMKHRFNTWERLGSDPKIGRLKTTHFAEFRRKGLDAGLSPATIESILSTVFSVLRFLANEEMIERIPGVGKRLKRRVLVKDAPAVESLGKVYRAIATTPLTWPPLRGPSGQRQRHSADQATAFQQAWWQAILATAYFTALRRIDLLTLLWTEVEGNRIVREMQKTGYVVRIPLHPVLSEHLDRLPRRGPFVFGFEGSTWQTRKYLARLANVAGVSRITFQAIRRLAARQWERARPGAGPAILGHVTGGASKFYLDPFEILVEALPTLAVPEGMGPQTTPQMLANFSALDALRGLSRDELVKLLGDLIAGKVPA